MASASRWLVLATLLWLCCLARSTQPSAFSASTASLPASAPFLHQGELSSDAARQLLSDEAQSAHAREERLMIDERIKKSQLSPPDSSLPPLASQGPGLLHSDTQPTGATTEAAATPADLRLLLPSKRRRTGLVLSLGAVSGLAHVLCSFRYEYYANMMTGNTIRWTLAMSRADAAMVSFFGTVVLSYLLGASIYRALDLYMIFRSTRVNGSAKGWTDPLHVERHKLQNLSLVSHVALVAFCSSDVVHHLVLRRKSTAAIKTALCRLSSLAVGFGMVNAAAQDSLNAVTNAATGHITRLGLGVVDKALLWHNASGKGMAGSIIDSDSPVFAVMAAAQGTAESTNLSFQFLAVLMSTLVLSSAACRRRWIPLDELDPVLGTLFGVAYAALLSWYTAPFVESPWGRLCRRDSKM